MSWVGVTTVYDPVHFCFRDKLFGIENPNPQGIWYDRRHARAWRVLPLIVNAQAGLTGNWVYGTLESHILGVPFENDQGKENQLYALYYHLVRALSESKYHFPMTFNDCYNSKPILQRLTAHILDPPNLAKAGGGRVETRGMPIENHLLRLDQVGDIALRSMRYTFNLINMGYIRVLRIPLNVFAAHIRATWDRAIAEGAFSGHASHDVTPRGRDGFLEVMHLWHTSGRSNRYMQRLIQTTPAAPGMAWIPAPHMAAVPPAAMPAPVVPPVVAMQPPIPAPAAPAIPAIPAPGVFGPVAAPPSPRTQALTLLSRAGPVAEPHGNLSPDILQGRVSYEDLCLEEKVLLALLPPNQTRSETGQKGTGRPCLAYKNGWGSNKQRSPGFVSREAMARAVWLWADVDWPNRVKHNNP